MAITSTSTKFKILKGLVANLPTAKTEGHVYVTTDERAMYVDISSTERIRLNDIIWAENYTALSAMTISAEQQKSLAFCSDGSILCRYDTSTKTWKQINYQKVLSELVKSAGYSYTDNSNKVATHLKLTGEDGKDVLAGQDFIVEGSAGTTTVSSSGSSIKVAAADTIKTTSATINQSNAAVTIQMAETTTGYDSKGAALTSSTEQTSSLTMSFAGAATSTSTTDKSVTIKVAPTQVNVAFDSSGTLSSTAKAADGSTIAAGNKVTPVISYGANGSTAKFLNGTATLDVYTKGEVDTAISDKLQAANAMVFQGSVDYVDTKLPTANVAAGATYIYNGTNGTSVSLGDGSSVNARVGDLFVASGTEGTDGYIKSVVWVHVPAGDDEHYTTSTSVTSSQFNVVQTYAGAKTTVGSVVVGSNLVGTASGNALTIAHKTLTATKTTNDVAGYSIPVVQALTFDAYGHVSGYTLGTLTVPNTKLTGVKSVATDDEAGTATITTTISDMGGNSYKSTQIVTSRDSSILVSSASEKLLIDIVWDTF